MKPGGQDSTDARGVKIQPTLTAIAPPGLWSASLESDRDSLRHPHAPAAMSTQVTLTCLEDVSVRRAL